MRKPPLGAVASVAPLELATCGSPRRWRSARKAPPGPLGLLEVQLALPTIQLILFADVLPHSGLVQAHRADAVPGRPEMTARGRGFMM